jgi:pyruvate/2-oxoacid:ferredoxin oxidoreductase alpha subunit
VDIPTQEEVDAFLPAVALPRRFDLDNPGYVSPTVTQRQYEGYRQLSQEAMQHALEVIRRVDHEFGERFGRSYGLVEMTGTPDADLVLVTTATITSTARAALAELEQEGIKVALCKLRIFRPFPVAAVRAALEGFSRVAVVERNISLGREGIFCSEIKSALVNSPSPPKVQGYLAGIGGTNVDPELIKRVVHHALEAGEFGDGPLWMRGEP